MSKEQVDEIVDGLLNNRLELTSFVSDSLEQDRRVQELETFKKSTEYTMDSISLEMIIENQTSDCRILLSELNDEKIYELEKQNKRYREAIRKAISHFNQDEHFDGMAELQKVLSESK